MRAIVERVAEAVVEIEGERRASIGAGLLVYLGVGHSDTTSDVDYLVEKIRGLRIFSDEDGKMNLSVADIGGAVLVVSAFSLQADARRGRRPSFDPAARPEEAQALYNCFCDRLAQSPLRVERGTFGAMMRIRAINDGPVCILLDSKRLF